MASMDYQPQRRRFQFRLRTLMIVTAIVALWACFTQFIPPLATVGHVGETNIYEPNVEWFIATGIAAVGIRQVFRRDNRRGQIN